MKLEVDVLPELMKYCLNITQKGEKFAFRNVLYSLRAHLEFENLSATGAEKRYMYLFICFRYWMSISAVRRFYIKRYNNDFGVVKKFLSIF